MRRDPRSVAIRTLLLVTVAAGFGVATGNAQAVQKCPIGKWRELPAPRRVALLKDQEVASLARVLLDLSRSAARRGDDATIPPERRPAQLLALLRPGLQNRDSALVLSAIAEVIADPWFLGNDREASEFAALYASLSRDGDIVLWRMSKTGRWRRRGLALEALVPSDQLSGVVRLSAASVEYLVTLGCAAAEVVAMIHATHMQSWNGEDEYILGATAAVVPGERGELLRLLADSLQVVRPRAPGVSGIRLDP